MKRGVEIKMLKAVPFGTDPFFFFFLTWTIPDESLSRGLPHSAVSVDHPIHSAFCNGLEDQIILIAASGSTPFFLSLSASYSTFLLTINWLVFRDALG